MKANILVVCGSRASDGLVRSLELNGYFCYQARGPLKLSSLLRQQPVDIIVWSESPANPALDEDLCLVWQRFATIPVIGLLRGEAAVSPAMRSAAMHEVVTMGDAARLLAVLARWTQRFRSDSVPQPPPASELAFRSALASPESSEPAGAPPAAGLLNPVATSLKPAERAILTPVSRDIPGFERRQWFSTLRRWLAGRGI